MGQNGASILNFQWKKANLYRLFRGRVSGHAKSQESRASAVLLKLSAGLSGLNTPLPRKLSNADFRQFIDETPRQPVARDEDDEIEAQQSAKKKKRAYRAPKYKGKKDQEQYGAGEEATKKKKRKYRDRTKEMKEGANPDYQLDQEIEFERMDMQISKHLGGDMAHTHMVKGLDYKLLNRIRREQQMEDAETLETEVARNKAREEQRKKLKVEVHFRSVLGRSIHQLLFPEDLNTGPAAPRSELFKPGRTIYEFNLDPRDHSNVPTTVTRSLDDIPTYEEMAPARIPPSLLSEVKKVIKGHRTGRRSRHHKRKLLMQKGKEEQLKKEGAEKKSVTTKSGSASNGASTKADAMEDDEDIFEGVGPYVFKPINKTKPSSSKGPVMNPARAAHIASLGGKTDKTSSSSSSSHGRSSRHDDRDRDRRRDDDRRSRFDRRERDDRPRHGSSSAKYSSRDSRGRRDRDAGRDQPDHGRSERDRSPPPSILKVAPKTEELAKEAQANLKRRDKLTLRERIEREQKEDPFGLAEIEFDEKGKQLKAKMTMGKRRTVDPYGLDFAVGAGMGMDDDSDGEAPDVRKRRKFENNLTKSSHQRIEQNNVDREWMKIQRLMKKK